LVYGVQSPPDPNAGLGDLAPISEVLGEVLGRYRLDHRGNVTVPALRHECVSWRLVSKALLQVSRETPTPYDALVDFAPGVPYVPRSFRVGGGVAFGVARRVWMLRVAYTGEVMVVTTTSSASASDDTERAVEKRWAMRHLVRSIGGQNANFLTRLPELARVIAGDEVPLMAYSVRVHVKKDQPSISHVHCGSPVHTSELCEFNNQIYGGLDYVAFGVERGPKRSNGRYTYSKTSTLAFCKADTDHTRNYEHIVVAEPIASVDSKRVPGNVLVQPYRRARRDRGIHPLTIALGYYEAPDIAQCGDWIVSLLNHGLEDANPCENNIDASNREIHWKFLGQHAMMKAEERKKLAVRSTALVLVHDDEGRESPAPLASGRPKRRQAYAAQTFIQAQTNMLNSLPRTYLLDNGDGNSSSDDEEVKETSDEDSESGEDEKASDSDDYEEEEEIDPAAAAAAERARAEADIW